MTRSRWMVLALVLGTGAGAIRTAGLTPPHGVWRVCELLDGEAR